MDLRVFDVTYLQPLIREKIVVFLELLAKLTPSDRTMRVKFIMPAAPRPWRALPNRSMGHATADAQSTLPSKIQNIWKWRAK